MDKETLRKLLPYAATALVAAGMGFAGGYLVGKRHWEACSDAAGRKLELAKGKRDRALEMAENKEALETVVGPIFENLSDERWHEEDDDASELAPDGDVVTPEEDEKPDLAELASRYSKIVKDEEEVELDEVEEDVGEEVVMVENGFHDDAVERIDQTEYLNGQPFNEKIPCMYFKPEGILAGGDELEEMDIGDTVGVAAIQELEAEPDAVIFIRNHELGEDYELSMAKATLREAMDELANSYPPEPDEED